MDKERIGWSRDYNKEHLDDLYAHFRKKFKTEVILGEYRKAVSGFQLRPGQKEFDSSQLDMKVMAGLQRKWLYQYLGDSYGIQHEVIDAHIKLNLESFEPRENYTIIESLGELGKSIESAITGLYSSLEQEYGLHHPAFNLEARSIFENSKQDGGVNPLLEEIRDMIEGRFKDSYKFFKDKYVLERGTFDYLIKERLEKTNVEEHKPLLSLLQEAAMGIKMEFDGLFPYFEENCPMQKDTYNHALGTALNDIEQKPLKEMLEEAKGKIEEKFKE